MAHDGAVLNLPWSGGTSGTTHKWWSKFPSLVCGTTHQYSGGTNHPAVQCGQIEFESHMHWWPPGTMCPDVDGLVSKTKTKEKTLLKDKKRLRHSSKTKKNTNTKAKTSSSMALFRNKVEALQVLREFGEFKNHTVMYIVPVHAFNCTL